MKKLYLVDTPNELLETIRNYYFTRKEISELTGLTSKQLRNLGGTNTIKSDYFIYSEGAYYSYFKLLELKLMTTIRNTGKHRAFSLVKNAQQFLKEYIDDSIHISDKRVLYVNNNLYFYDFFNDNLIALSGKHKGNLAIKGIFDLSELEKELTEDARKNLINSFQFKKENHLSSEEIKEIDEYVIN